MKKYILAIDQGTSSCRAVLFDESFGVAGIEQKETQTSYPHSGWVEQDAIEIWENQLAVIQALLAKKRVKASEIAGIGITNQRETTVIWDKSGKPVYKAIIWQDRRTSQVCEQMKESEMGKYIPDATGLIINPYFSATKIAWILDNVPGIREKAEAGEIYFGTIDSWLIWNLSGGQLHITDYSNASRTMLFNINEFKWDHKILEYLNIPASILPEVVSSSRIYGETATEILGESIPIAGIAGDQQAALYGQKCYTPGSAKNTYGTGCFMLLNTGEKSVQSKFGLLTTVGYKIGDQPAVYALEGSIAIAGSLVQWFRDNLGLINESHDIEDLARTVKDTGGIYFVPAFSGLFAPHWRSDARGLISGLTHYIHKGHIARAVLEASAYQAKEIFEAMEKDSGIHLTALKVDGGMVSNELLMQFQADILDIPVICPKNRETSVLGAAYAAGLAVGFWKDQSELKKHWAIDKKWEGKMPEEKRQVLYNGWMKAVRRSYS